MELGKLKPSRWVTVPLLILLFSVVPSQNDVQVRSIPALKNGLCSMLSSDDLVAHGQKHQYPNGIPKIIHYVYKTAYIPYQYSAHIKQCMAINKDASFVFWTDLLSYRFMITSFPEYVELFSSHFAKIADPLKVSDLIRYFILLKFGGVYMDLDTRCQKPLDPVFNNNSCILSREPEEQTRILWNMPYLAMNSFMACTAGHDFFKYLIPTLTKGDSTWVVAHTGPIMLTKIFEQYNKNMKQSNSTNSTQSVIVADAYMFSPHSEPFLEGRCNNPSGHWKVLGCKNLAEHRRLQKTKTNEAVVVHLFLHLGYNFAKQQIKVLDNICSVFQNMNMVYH